MTEQTEVWSPQEQVAAFARAVFDPADIVELRLINRATDDVISKWWNAGTLTTLVEALRNYNAGGRDIYIGANPRPTQYAKGDACIALARCVFAEFDGGDATVERVLARIEELGLPRPTLVLHSGHGVHCYWRLAEPIRDMSVFTAMQAALSAALGSDPVIKNPERIMRLCGFANLKRDDGAVAELIECDPARVYDLSEISDRLRVDAPGAVPSDGADDAGPADEDVEGLAGEHARRARASRNGSGSVIDAFNERTTIDALLATLGFTRIPGKPGRWKRPGKDHAGHSVIVRDGRSFHFSSADPFNDGKFGNGTVGVHDAFDLWCAAEHGGRVNDAVRAAAEQQGVGHPRRKDPSGEAAAAQAASPVEQFKDPPIPLNEAAPPELPDDIFTGTLGEMIEAVARATETPRELAAGIALAVVATACQRRFTVRLEAGYFEPLNIWCLVAMAPGNRKSAVVRHLMAPLARWEQLRRAEVEPRIKAAAAQHKTLSARIDGLRARAAKTANPTGFQNLASEISQLELELPAIPTVPRLIAGDVTNEHLGTMIAANGERIGIISDEGGIFETIAGRYSNGVANLDLYLQGYSGSFVRIDRGSRPSVALEFPALTLGLSPQPDVLRGLASKPGFKGRGLLDRPLYLVPPSQLGYRTLVPHEVPPALAERFERDVTDLIDVQLRDDVDPPVPHTLTLSGDAKAQWKAFQRQVETMLRPDGKMGGLAGWGSKLPGNIARVAGLMHCAARSFRAVADREIEAATMAAAIRFGHVLIEHARIVFREMGADPAMEAARRLWAVIERNRRATFKARDAWQPLRGSYKRVLDVAPGFDLLIDHNLIAEPHQADFARAGRPSRLFVVHPKVVEGWR